jgi:hypothetical protein
MPEASYIICAITSLTSGVLLARSYRQNQNRLLFWTSVFFFGMVVNNILLLVDRLIGPQVDWSVPPNVVMLVSVAALLYGLIWDGA